MKIELFLPFPPSINQYYVKTRNGLFISNKGRAFRAGVLKDVKIQCGSMSPISTYVHTSVVLFMPDKRKRDLDNYIKPLLDSLTQCGFWIDDSLVQQFFVYRGEQQPSGSVFMRISPAGPIIRRGDLHLLE